MAAKVISSTEAITLFIFLLTFAGILSSKLPLLYIKVAIAYFVISIFYSFILKKMVAIDVILLAILYTLRILAGGAACDLQVSHWLLAFSTFFFFGLAMLKRFTELDKSTINQQKMTSRGYTTSDKQAIFHLGSTSNLLCVLIVVLYLNSEEVKMLYQHDKWLWLITPILLYWSTHFWMKASRGEIHDDPVIAASQDFVTWIAIALVTVVILVSI